MRSIHLLGAALAFLTTIAVGVCLMSCSHVSHRAQRQLHIALRPVELDADGWSEFTLLVHLPPGVTSDILPEVSIPNHSQAAVVSKVIQMRSGWQVHIRAGTMPGTFRLITALSGFHPAEAKLRLRLAESDLASDGTPDFLRLDDEHDRKVFRKWFTLLAEEQYFLPLGHRPAEITDCAALVRYAFREALRLHDGPWTASAGLLFVPAIDSVSKYSFPYTAVGTNIFRIRRGAFSLSDLDSGAFAQFADAATIRCFNTHFVTREIDRALPGDLLFFQRSAGQPTQHTMIFLGLSQISGTASSYVVYHTGPSGNNPGEMRRLSISELVRFPNPEWRPVASNPNFLGVFRWNILRQTA